MLSNLKNVPFIGKAVGFVTNNVRLAIEYALIALLLISAGVATTLWYRTNLIEKRNEVLWSRVTTNEAVNKQQDDTITNLREQRAVDALVIAGIIDDYARLTKSDVLARRKLAELEIKHANVRDYLNTALPPELVCLLNPPCATKASATDGVPAPAGSPTPSVLRAGAAKN